MIYFLFFVLTQYNIQQNYHNNNNNIKQMQKSRKKDLEQFQKFKDQQFTKAKRQNHKYNIQQNTIISLNLYDSNIDDQQTPILAPILSHITVQYLDQTQQRKRDISEKCSILTNKIVQDNRQKLLTNNQGLFKNQRKIRYNISANKRIYTESRQLTKNPNYRQQKRKDNINTLKKILQEYQIKSQQNDLFTNLNHINPNSQNISNDNMNKCISINKLNPKISIRKDYNKRITNLIKIKQQIKLKQLQKYQQLYNYQFISLEAQGLNNLIKQFIQNKKNKKIIKNNSNIKLTQPSSINQPINILNRQSSINNHLNRSINYVNRQSSITNQPNNSNKLVNNNNNNSIKNNNKNNNNRQLIKRNGSKNDNYDKMKIIENQSTNSINMKINKYRQFLFIINFTNNIYRELDINKYNKNYKIYIGKGNNNNLIKSIMKKRFWFQITKNPTEAHFIWTQLKQQRIYEEQLQKYNKNQDKNQSTKLTKDNNIILQTQQTKSKKQSYQTKINNKIKIQKINNNNNNQLNNLNKVQSLQKIIRQLKWKSNNIYNNNDNNNDEQINSQKISHRQYNKEPVVQLQIKRIEIKQMELSNLKQNQNIKLNSISHFVNQSSINTDFNKFPLVKTDNPTSLHQKLRYTDLKPSRNKPKNIQINKNHIKIMTKTQYNLYNEILQDTINKKKYRFSDRIKYFKQNYKTINQQKLYNNLTHNHLPINGLLGNKKAMFYMLKQYYKICNKNIFDIIPLTFHIKKGKIDNQFTSFIQQYNNNRLLKDKSNFWIIKPGQFSNRGKGITCTDNLQDIKNRINSLKNNKKNSSLILQQYITNPLLYNNRKFDIRAYMMITINNGKLRGYWYHDGYIRTSSYPWSLQTINDNLVHLTNDAIQKHAANYGKYEAGNKLNYTQLQRYVDALNKNGKAFNFHTEIYPIMKNIAADAIKSTFCFLDPSRKGNNFQIFGFDFMIDNDYKPWLIQINTNPCLQISCPVLQRIIPNMLQNAFRIAIDPIFPPPSNFSSTYKYTIPQNAIHYNKFELIFDQQQDGLQLIQLYKNNTIIDSIDQYQQDKEIYQQQGQQFNLQIS